MCKVGSGAVQVMNGAETGEEVVVEVSRMEVTD